MQKIHHLGAKNCVTSSCHLVQSRSINILVDCGKAYGHDPELPFDRFPVQPDKIDYLFLTHAQIDHIGRVPDLIDAGFKGEIICTHATKALLIPMLHDALSFSGRTDKDIHRLEAAIDDLSWGFELYSGYKAGFIERLLRWLLSSRFCSKLNSPKKVDKRQTQAYILSHEIFELEFR